ncbi:uncharacterized protein LOC130698385 [Daphnia carinata]|uniref:uncharacterized protein LOC130698385 n=1 Tax=Daphnia carinata TaxID=120202 RepID=UPI0028687B7C|nr:uncharacterized protein LOC130698385 [Daphnia carinata]
MTILKILLVVVTLTSVTHTQQTTNQDLMLASTKGKRHISHVDPYGSLQFHKPPIPSIDYYGESDKSHGGYIVVSHEKGKKHKSKGKGGGYGYSGGYNGYTVAGGNGGGDDSSEGDGNGGGFFGDNYYVAKIKGKGKGGYPGKGKGGYPSKGKGGSYRGKGKKGYGKGKGESYGKGGKHKGKGSYGSKGKGSTYGGKGKGGTPYGSGGYNPPGNQYGGGGYSQNNGNGGYFYVSGAISNSYGSSGIKGPSYENSGIGYNSFGNSQSGGSSSENSGGSFSAYGGGGTQGNFYSGGGTEDSSYGGGGVDDTNGGGDDFYGVGGIGDSYGGGGTDDSYGNVGISDSYGVSGVDDSYGGGGGYDSYGGDGGYDSYGGGGGHDSYGGGGYGIGGGIGGSAEIITGGIVTTGDINSGAIPTAAIKDETPSAVVTSEGDTSSGKTEGGNEAQGGTASTTSNDSQSSGGGTADITGRKRSPPDTTETTDKPPESTTVKSNDNTNSDSEKRAKTTVNYNLSINANGDTSAANGNGNNNTVKVDFKTDGTGTSENAFSLSVQISSGSNGNNSPVRYDAPTTSRPTRSSSTEEIDRKITGEGKAENSRGSSTGPKRSIAQASKTIQEIPDSIEKQLDEPEIIEHQPEVHKPPVTVRQPIKPVAPVKEPLKAKTPTSTPDTSSSSTPAPRTASSPTPAPRTARPPTPAPRTARPPSTTSAKPSVSNNTVGRNVNNENILRQSKNINETLKSKATPSPAKNITLGQAKPNAAINEEDGTGCTSGCFSIPPITIQTNSTEKINATITDVPGKIRQGREQIIGGGRKQTHIPIDNLSISHFERPTTSKKVPKGTVQAEITSGVAIKENNTSGITGKEEVRLIGSTTSFVNIPGDGNTGFETIQHVENGGQRSVGTANKTRQIPRPTPRPATADIPSFFEFDVNDNKDSESPKSINQNETKHTISSTSTTVRPTPRHNPRHRPTTSTEDTISAGVKVESTKESRTANNAPADGRKRNPPSPSDAHLNVTRQTTTRRPRPAVEGIPPFVEGFAAVNVSSRVLGIGQREMDIVNNGPKNSLNINNGTNVRPQHFPRHAPTHKPTPTTERQPTIPEITSRNAGKDQRRQVNTTPLPGKTERDHQTADVKVHTIQAVNPPLLVPYLPIDTYYLPLRRHIMQKALQHS